MSATPAAANAWSTLRAWSPVVTVVVALFASLAILIGAALGRMEGRLRADVAAVAVDLRADMADVRADVAELAAEVRELRTDVHALSDRVARIEDALTAPHVVGED